MLNELKALNLHTCRDITQEHLLGIYINILDDETFELVATDGASLLKKTYLTEEWCELCDCITEETGFSMPGIPTCGFLRMDNKIRKLTGDKKVFLPLSEESYNYPKYQKLCPDLDEAKLLTDFVPFSFVVMERIKKTYNLLCIEEKVFARVLTMPDRKPISAVYQLLVGGWYMIVMPMSPIKNPENKITK